MPIYVYQCHRCDVRTELFLHMPLTERGFAVIMEELYWAKRMGATVAAVPTSQKEDVDVE